MSRSPQQSVDLEGDTYKLSSRRTFDRWGQTYDHNLIVRLFAWQWDNAALADLEDLAPGSSVLDLGCATGRLLDKLAAKGHLRLAGADLSEVALMVARDKLDSRSVSADLQQCDIEQELPWAAAEFDAVVLSGVLHHLPHPARAIAEARRVLKPGGRLIVADPFIFTPLRQMINAILRIQPINGDCMFHHPGKVVAMVEQARFKEACWRRISWHSFMTTGAK